MRAHADGRSLGVTHPVLPCGAKMLVRYGGETLLTEVIDNELRAPGASSSCTERSPAGSASTAPSRSSGASPTGSAAEPGRMRSCSTLCVAPGSIREPTRTRRELGSGRGVAESPARHPPGSAGSLPARGSSAGWSTSLHRPAGRGERRCPTVGRRRRRHRPCPGRRTGGLRGRRPALLRRAARARGDREAAAAGARGAAAGSASARRSSTSASRTTSRRRRRRIRRCASIRRRRLERARTAPDGSRGRRRLGARHRDTRSPARCTRPIRGATGSSSSATPDRAFAAFARASTSARSRARGSAAVTAGTKSARSSAHTRTRSDRYRDSRDADPRSGGASCSRGSWVVRSRDRGHGESRAAAGASLSAWEPSSSSVTRRGATPTPRCGSSSTATGSSRRTPPGSSDPLAGLTLLEAAAVPGETLAADALANALGAGARGRARPGSRRGRDERRRRQRRDAPACAPERGRRHAAAVARPARSRRRARVLLAGGRHLRAARRVTRSGCPHVTLDLREEFRRPS